MLKKLTSKTYEQINRSYIKMLRNPAGERNKQPILEVLQSYIDANRECRFLEISSGCGLHVSFFSTYFPKVTFQPSEYDINSFGSIREYTKGCKNVFEPIFIDISQDLNFWESSFEEKPLKTCTDTFDYILNINMIHITPFTCTEGLFNNCSKLLKSNGLLFTYGPYSMNSVLTPESNVSFNESLKSRNASWGIRDICDLKQLAENNFMELYKIHDLPANNKLLVFRKK